MPPLWQTTAISSSSCPGDRLLPTRRVDDAPCVDCESLRPANESTSRLADDIITAAAPRDFPLQPSDYDDSLSTNNVVLTAMRQTQRKRENSWIVDGKHHAMPT